MKNKQLLLIIVNVLIILLLVGTNIFGSTMDFLNQHIIFPEYLREQFYQTGKIIPSLTMFGAGENIYNIAYYGLLNPIILISYLFPFIKMIDYIIISNIILLILSNILFYKFVNNKFDTKISFTLSLLFTLSGPLIFQFHRHFMFVNYMPFLLMSLMSIDKNKKISLILNVFLIIMTSFYYSIPSIIVIIMYFIYVNYNNFKLKEFLKIIRCILISILLSSILLLPTLNAIISTRSGGNSEFLSLLIPYINLDNILYGAYSPGLTSIAFISLVYLLFTKKHENIFLSIVISIICFVPIFLYLLNGGLYARSKILIPLLPLLIYIIGLFLNDLFNDKIDIKKFLLFLLIVNLIVLIKYHVLIYYLDLLFTIILIIIYNKTKLHKLFLLPLVILNIFICFFLNKTEDFISHDYYEQVSKSEAKIDDYYRVTNLNNNKDTINKTYNNLTPNIYSSTINRYYYNLYHNVFKVNNPFINNLMLGSTSNVLFNEYLGVKYVISDEVLGYPYKLVEDNLYELKQALPLAYVNSNTVNRKYYESLSYPYNLDILLNYVIDDNSTNEPISKIKKINLDYTYEIGKNIEVIQNENEVILKVINDDEIVVNLENNLNEKILFINFYGLESNDDDIKMTINNQTNLLTKNDWLYPNNNNNFYFCLNDVKDKLYIKFTKGTYHIKNIETYILDNKEIENINNNLDFLNIDYMDSERISGNINVVNNGYFVVSLPYDKGFKILVNNEEVNYQVINDTFIGLYLNKGNYKIDIKYSPPLLKEGIALSIIGLALFMFLLFKKNITK